MGQLELADSLAQKERDQSIKNSQQMLKPNDDTDCIECGIEIPLKRKEFMPSATRCIECQSELEDNHAKYAY